MREAEHKDMSNYRKYELFRCFDDMFYEQMGLELSNILDIKENKYVLKIEPMGLFMASIGLVLSDDMHKQMAEFLEAVKLDTSRIER